jgi:hypothetical protein
VEQFSAQIEVCLLARGRYRLSIERARVDGLTGLYTRRYFVEQFETEVTRCEQYGDTFLLVIFDADGLKRVNDVFGHRAGDRMLVAIADALSPTSEDRHHRAQRWRRVHRRLHGRDPNRWSATSFGSRPCRAAPLEFEGTGFRRLLIRLAPSVEGRTIEELFPRGQQVYALRNGGKERAPNPEPLFGRGGYRWIQERVIVLSGTDRSM